MAARPFGAAETNRRLATGLPQARSVLAVVAHPDDESFGLGATLEVLANDGAEVSVVCLTRGEASTFGGRHTDLADHRAREFSRAAEVLGAKCVELLAYPDDGLDRTPLDVLAAEIVRVIGEIEPDLLLVFDEGGITGHRDHQRATAAAVRASGEVPVLAWSITSAVAAQLNAEFDATYLGRRRDELDFSITVERDVQRRAIACHRGQSLANRALWRRLELQGSEEVLRWLRKPKRFNGPDSARS